MKYALMVIAALLLINLIFLAFVSNFSLGLVLQGLLSILLILYAFYFNKIAKSWHITIGIFCLIPLVFITFLAVYGNADNAEFDEDAVIVLGAGIRGEQVSLTLARRLDEAVKYHNKNPGAVIVVCGGQGAQEHITEALAMERYLIAKGVPQGKIIKEEKSTSTYENCSFAREVLRPYFPQGFSSVLITNDFHVYRATRLAQYAGISVKHIGTHTKWYTVPVNYLREMCAVIIMWVKPPVGLVQGINDNSFSCILEEGDTYENSIL